MNPADLGIAEARSLLAAGRLTATRLLDACLERIGARDGSLHAVTRLLDTARDEAAAADRAFSEGRILGPLHGLPVGIKEVIDLDGLPTRCGSAVPAAPADTDAVLVARLRAGGAVIVASLATYEFATVGPDDTLADPAALNPWNPARVTGGSSSGCASAVAGGLMRTSVGTDTAGSLRSPAAYCGVVGLKPSFGRVPTRGVVPLAPSLDCPGPISASVEDAALTLDAISGPGWTSAAASLDQPLAGLRIGYLRDWVASDPATAPAMLKALDATASTLSLLGARIEEVTLPDYALFETAASVILGHEALALHLDRIRSHWRRYGRASLPSLLTGLALDAADLDTARSAQAVLRAEVDAALEGRAALLTATTLAPAPPVAAFAGGAAVWTPMRTIPFSLTGHPALSVPAGFDGGLPLGIQLVGAMGAEATLCRIGHGFERATDHSVTRPPLRLAPGR
jgi:aspartyl-tRNA(Asn)/glutamyl-tRNA(Gln) amidotransferase subunit A